MFNVRVGSLVDAIEMAERLKREGSHDWFRGQKGKHKVKASWWRLSETERAAAMPGLERFDQWVREPRQAAVFYSPAQVTAFGLP